MAATATMPRAPSENTFQVAFKIPEKWIEMADEIARAMSQPGIANTRTDALRAALWHGLNELHAQHVKSPPADRKSEPKSKKR
jgi:hypothetical protein